MSQAVVSIIVPLYNAEKYMMKSIESILRQTYSAIEVILVDDGSVDNTLVICNAYGQKDDRVVVISQKNAGPGAARNNGLQRASGEYVCFVDSDDELHEAAIERMLNAFSNDCDLVQCRSQKIYHDGSIDNESWPKEVRTLDNVNAMKDYVFSAKPIIRYSVWAKMIRKTAVDDLLFMPYAVCEDVVFTAYLIDRCRKITYIPDVLYYVDVRNGSITHSNFSLKKAQGRVYCNQEMIILMFSHSKYEMLRPRVYWTAILTLITITNQCVEKQCKEEKAIIAFLRDECVRQKIPLKYLTFKSIICRTMYCIMPITTARIVQRFLLKVG